MGLFGKKKPQDDRYRGRAMPVPMLYLRFDIDELKGGAYGATSHRILFTEVQKELLWNCMLFMGDSADTLAGRENIAVIGISAPVERLKEIQAHLSKYGKEFQRVCDHKKPMQLVPVGGNEPLVLEGIFYYDGIKVQNNQQTWAQMVFSELKKEGKL